MSAPHVERTASVTRTAPAWLAGVTDLLPGRRDYRDLRRTWRSDVVAGLTVGIVALPLALAFGVTSGVGAEAGLVTAIVAGIVAAVLGGSHVQVSGPTGAMVVVLAPIVAAHGAGAVVLVSLMAGIAVAAAGALRLGRTITYIPWPVVEGFTLGIGVIIALQQIPAAVGIPARGHSTNAAVAAVQSLGEAAWPDALVPLALVVLTGAVILVTARLSPRAPGSFLAIAVATVAVVALHLDVPTIGALPASLPAPAWPGVDLALVRELSGPALAVAALAAIESLLSARVAASLADTGPYDADRELVGQGLASVASGLFGGMPATGAIARTAVNVRSGGRTRLAAVVHALVLLAVVYVAAPVVSQIPLAALSGVLLVTAARMVSPAVVRTMFRSTRSDALVFSLTAVVTVSFDLVVAVGIGLAAAAFFALRALSRASGVHREELPGPVQPDDERIALFRVDGALFFGATERMVDRVAEHQGIDVVVLRLSQLQILDATGAHALAELVSRLERRGVTVLLKGIRPQHVTLMRRLAVLDSLRHQNHLFDELAPAVEHARSHVARARTSALH